MRVIRELEVNALIVRLIFPWNKMSKNE